MKQTVQAKCTSCEGTGIYCGFAEPKGVGVVCLSCDGSGCKTIEYEPFNGRVRRNTVHTVRQSRGTFIATGVGPAGGSVTYEEFWNGKRP